MKTEVIFDSDHNHVPSEDLARAECTPPTPGNPPPVGAGDGERWPQDDE